MLDVGTGNSPYLEWFDWIENKYSIDLETPYQSNNVTGIKGNIFDTNFDSKFDVVTCLQVLEHVHDAYKFAQRLLQLGTIILVSVPYKWPKGKSPDHIHDPIDHFKIDSWFGRPPNYSIVVREPLLWVCHERLISIYHVDPGAKWGLTERGRRMLRD